MEPLFTFGDLVLVVVAAVDRHDRDTDAPGEVRSAPGGSAANFAVWTARLGDRHSGGCGPLGRVAPRDGLLLLREGPRRATLKAIALAREAGVPISLDPSSAGFIRRYGLRVPQGLRVLMPNRDEALALTGQEDVAEAARRLAEQAELVAIKLGPDGALLAFDGRLVHVEPAAPDGPVVDVTGARDAWGAAFVHGLRSGLDPAEAARRANRLGARVVARIGARPAVNLADLVGQGPVARLRHVVQFS